MQPPIVLSESGDIAIFKDLDSLLRYVEPIDVANGEYVVYDSEGRRLHLHTNKTMTRALFGLLRDESYAPVTMEEEEEPSHDADLHAVLLNALRSIDAEERGRPRNLDETLASAIEKFGYTT